VSSRKAVEDFVERLKAVAGGEVELRAVRFASDLYDIEVTHEALGMTVCLGNGGETLRLLVDPDYVIEGLSPPETLEFVAALVAGRAIVRVSEMRIFGKVVDIDVELGPSRHLTARRNWGSGLASWERQLLEQDSGR
jgi:hypothetical protein